MEPSRPATAPYPSQVSDDFLRVAMDGAMIGMCVTSAAGEFLKVNSALCELFGRTEADLLNCTWADLNLPEDVDEDRAMGQDIIDGRISSLQITKRHLKSDGTIVWVDLSVTAIRDEQGDFRYFFSQMVDVTEKRRVQAALLESRERYRMLAENASDVVYQANLDGSLAWISGSVTDLIGWRPEDMVGRQFAEFSHPADQAVLQEGRDRLATGKSYELELRVRSRDGSYRWVSASVRPLYDRHGNLTGRAGGWRDIHSTVDARRALAASEQRFRLAMDSAPTGMAVVGLNREFLEVNPAMCQMLGRAEDWLLKRRIVDVLTPEDAEIDAQMHESVLAGRATSSVREIRLVTANGSTIWVEHSVGLLRDQDGIPLSFVSQFVNVTEAKQSRDELSYLATHDSMTELLNRRELLNQLDLLANRKPRLGTRTALLYIDIDDLKEVNDAHGHDGGDAVIVEIAKRIAQEVRANDPVARIGGDEFVVALAGVHNIDDAHRMASKIQHAASMPIAFETHLIRATISVGVAMLMPEETPGETLRHSDHALYAAKRSGRALVVSYSPECDLDRALGTAAPTARAADEVASTSGAMPAGEATVDEPGEDPVELAD
ncbi:MAG: PAS domain S-box protein [Candidatus Nanopelagicales bacterium]